MLNSSDIKYLIIHCSDTPDDKYLSAIDIHKMHLDFGWDGIGYHKVICRDGKIENGRPEYWVGAHTFSKNNLSLGVCLIGREKFNHSQFSSLYTLLSSWKKKYLNSLIIGHCEAISTKKTCPNFNVQKWCKKVGLNE